MINQILPTLSYGDAVSNSAVNIMKILRDMGIESNIYAQNIHPKMERYAKKASLCPKDQTIIYHLSTGSDLAYEIPSFKKKKILVYHNVTPAHFFVGYSGVLKKLCEEGREQLAFLSNYIDLAIADSEFNRLELEVLNYKNTFTSSIIINYEDYTTKSDFKKFPIDKKDENINILFVGRIAPNKKQEDIIKSFYYYRNYINKSSKLSLVGSYEGMDRYYRELQKLVQHLKLEDSVNITGHIPFNDILNYYNHSDLFLCMSEHEGFCVPIIEAMYFDLPIVAYKSTAVTETLGNGGIVTLEKNHKEIAELMNVILKDEELKSKIHHNQRNQLQKYSKTSAEDQFKNILKQFII
ncbi:glycosyltransferase family 4 protein [Paenibacillus nitricinens]|uniref:glycosyltransferase family 4 protein n=1 Tax=Paenibacillus nitricinens TaxID=3367691 RepID=UPI003F858FAE